MGVWVCGCGCVCGGWGVGHLFSLLLASCFLLFCFFFVVFFSENIGLDISCASSA